MYNPFENPKDHLSYELINIPRYMPSTAYANLQAWFDISYFAKSIVNNKITDPKLKALFIRFSSELDTIANNIKANGKSAILKSRYNIMVDEEYPLFASYTDQSHNQVKYNITLLDSMPPKNENLFISSLLYAITLTKVSPAYKPNTNELIDIAAVYFSMFLKVFGKKYGLTTLYEWQRELLYLIIGAYVYSSFSKDTKLESFMSILINNNKMKHVNSYKDLIPKQTDEYNTMEKIVSELSRLKITDINYTILKTNLFSYMGAHGVVGIESYPYWIAYITATSIINPVFTAVVKSFNNEAYKRLMKRYLMFILTR